MGFFDRERKILQNFQGKLSRHHNKPNEKASSGRRPFRRGFLKSRSSKPAPFQAAIAKRPLARAGVLEKIGKIPSRANAKLKWRLWAGRPRERTPGPAPWAKARRSALRAFGNAARAQASRFLADLPPKVEIYFMTFYHKYYSYCQIKIKKFFSDMYYFKTKIS
jgi:hypothetical protein